MRDFKGMKRQRGRNRGSGGSSGKPQQHNANRAFESNGPDNLKIRGHAQHVYEKYQQLARDAASAGDRVLGENFLQHAEHYFRVLRTLQPNRPYTDFIGREGFASGYDIDFEDEMGEAGEEGEGAPEGAEAQPSEERGDYQSRDGQNRDSQNRDNQPREQRWDNRNGEGRNGEGRNDQNRSDNRGGDRNYNSNGGRNRDRNYNRDQGRDQGRDDRGFNRDQPRDQARDASRDQSRDNRAEGQEGERYSRRERSYEPREARDPQRDPLPMVEPQAEPLTRETPARASSPREPAFAEARQPSAQPDAPGRVLRSRDGEESHAPAFLQSAPASPMPLATEAEAPVKRPRGRPRKKVEETAPEEA